ncbi:hypothetical protein ETH_00031765 [Eimeria tenella]|uniref:Uncharacterized protein n=1 Tax=Eimeria tenella TaxID=5802 RepID=U6KXG6_EIMTE|nr:hypothetical protein ETH_00031765 [Eimeria tenella]CDJ42852.1 hypothetical protein ETH_00031765 [Eimeria tenella]|eukprot:XP_013233602.1 hypothetical protein ETH_00031765 [Eimeria tenella]
MQHTTTEVCDRPQASWYYSRGPRPTRTVSARHHFHGSNSFFSRLPNWSFRSLTHRRKRSPSLHDPVYTDAPHAYVVEETYRTLSPTEHEDVTQASQYVADEGSRPLIQVEALQHQLAALRESNRTLSRDITDQGKLSRVLNWAQELSTVRKQYMQQTAEVAKLSEQYDAIRQSSDSAAVELAAARKQLSMAKAEAGLAASDRIDLMKENSHLRQEYTQAMAHIAALQQDLGKLRSVQKDFDQATAALERSRQIHAVDREQIMRMEEELKAFSENEKQIMLIQREAEVARRQSSKLLKELHEAQEAIKAFQEVSERNSWVSVYGYRSRIRAALVIGKKQYASAGCHETLMYCIFNFCSNVLKLEEERRRLLPFETECDRMRARLVLEENRIKEITVSLRLRSSFVPQ